MDRVTYTRTSAVYMNVTSHLRNIECPGVCHTFVTLVPLCDIYYKFVRTAMQIGKKIGVAIGQKLGSKSVKGHRWSLLISSRRRNASEVVAWHHHWRCWWSSGCAGWGGRVRWHHVWHHHHGRRRHRGTSTSTSTVPAPVPAP
jgi:hypothetical protein